MDISTLWKFLHIASMFLAVSIFVGQGMLSGAVHAPETSMPSAAFWYRKTGSRRSAARSSCWGSCSGSSPRSLPTST